MDNYTDNNQMCYILIIIHFENYESQLTSQQ